MFQKSMGDKISLLGLSMFVAVTLTFGFTEEIIREGLPKNVFLLGFYTVPIILAANYYGLAGGIGLAALSTVLAIAFARISGITLREIQLVPQSILFFLVGGFAGFMRRENIRIQNELKRASITDERTGLYNYKHFRQRLDEEVARAERYGRFLSLVLYDIDNFKKYNDTFGHPQGNVVLREIASFVRRSVRASDIPFRYGGDEFAVILPETGAAAVKAAQRVAAGVGDAIVLEDIARAFKLSLTAGAVYIEPGSSLSPSQLISMADHALYEAKRSGQKVVMFHLNGDRTA